MSNSSSASSGWYSANFKPVVNSCTACPNIETSAPYRAAFSLSIFNRHSIPGNGLSSSISTKPPISFIKLIIFCAPIDSFSELKDLISTSTGLPDDGPDSAFRT